jgi:hypothetical protein
MFVAHRDAEHYLSLIWWRVLFRIAIVVKVLSESWSGGRRGLIILLIDF